MWRILSQCTVTNTSCWHADHQPTTIRTRGTRSVPVFCYLVVYLIKCWKDIIGELDFGDRLHAFCSSTYSKTYQPLLAERCVEDTFCAKVCCQVHGASEDASKLYVLSEYQHPLVCLEGMAQCFVHGGVEVDTLCLPFAYLGGEFGVCKGGLGSMVQYGRSIILDTAIEACASGCGRVSFALGLVLAAWVERRVRAEEIAR
jgi:hypothetical protein